MPTATTTITRNGPAHISLKAVVISPESQKSPPFFPPSSSHSSPTGSATTVRTLYNRATRAFLHRDIQLTYTLLDAAFAILKPPLTSAPDILADDRRKWDILRITLESTVYASTPTHAEQSTLPDALRANLLEAPYTLISKLHTRSLALFTPVDSVIPSASAAYIPPQVLATLVLAGLRADCAEIGRVMIEDWLAHREPTSTIPGGEMENEDGYAKILDLYCLNVLPKLQQWDYASEFLEYESELPAKMRERFKSHLGALHMQSLADLSQSSELIDGSDSKTPRPYSPAPSSSSSSSLSTTSTHTVVPSFYANGRPPARPRSSSGSSKSDATARAVPRSAGSRLPVVHTQNGNAQPAGSRARSKSRPASSNGSATHPTTLPRAPPFVQSTDVTRLSTYSLIKATIRPYLTTSRLATLFLLLVVLPLASWLLRKRRKARLAGASSATNTVSAAEMVRRRLGGVEAGLASRVWVEVRRAFTDTVKMAGSGLV